jgi:hypothetical protein
VRAIFKKGSLEDKNAADDKPVTFSGSHDSVADIINGCTPHPRQFCPALPVRTI